MFGNQNQPFEQSAACAAAGDDDSQFAQREFRSGLIARHEVLDHRGQAGTRDAKEFTLDGLQFSVSVLKARRVGKAAAGRAGPPS